MVAVDQCFIAIGHVAETWWMKSTARLTVSSVSVINEHVMDRGASSSERYVGPATGLYPDFPAARG